MSGDVAVNSTQILTEPLTIREVAILLGQDRKAARKFIQAAGGIACGSLWQIPIDRMPFSYHQCANVGQIGPMWPDLADSKSVQHSASDGARLPGMNQLLTERDAAIQLRITLDDLNDLLESGALPYVTVSGEIRICASDLQQMIRRSKTQTALPRRRRNECQL